MAIQITISDLSTKIEAGWKKAQLAEHYGLPMSQMTQVLQQAGLRIRKFHHPKFELINDVRQEPYNDIPVTDITEINTTNQTTIEERPVVLEEVMQNTQEEPVASGTW